MNARFLLRFFRDYQQQLYLEPQFFLSRLPEKLHQFSFLLSEFPTCERNGLLIRAINIQHFNSNDRETTLTNIKARKGVCLAPGFLNDHNGEFAWTLFDCREKISCVLCTHAGDKRESVLNFVKLLQKIYQKNLDFKF